MYNLLAAIQNHENVPHTGRFAIVTFLHHIGLSNEEVFRVRDDERDGVLHPGVRDDEVVRPVPGPGRPVPDDPAPPHVLQAEAPVG